jgi:NADP-dependent 3-hydroxy acid dehydrogenase YdfG
MSEQRLPSVALVTGAAGGMGGAMVDAFIEREVGVVAMDRDAVGLAALRSRSPVFTERSRELRHRRRLYRRRRVHERHPRGCAAEQRLKTRSQKI